MTQKFYKIVDKNGYEMPEHYSGRNRTYEEAQKMVDNLNKNGEHRPYTMIETQQTENYPKDISGQIVKLGDKVRGFGSLKFQDGFEIDRTPIVTVNLQKGVLYFGNLSAKSFTDGFEIAKNLIK